MTETPSYGCEEFHRAAASRRTFLKGLGAVTAGGVMATMHGTVFRQTAFADGTASNILVVLSLRGGVDGMSLVVPYADADYYTLRPKIGIPAASLIGKDGSFGLHPKLAPLLPYWKANQLAAVNAVGLPQPNLSHVSATEEVEDADPGSTTRCGWLNRMVGMTDPGNVVAAVQVGTAVPETEVYGPQPILSTTDIMRVKLAGPPHGMPQRRAALDSMWDDVEGDLGEGVRQAMETNDVWSPVLKESQSPQNGAQYPATDLGDALAQSARVIRADVGAQVITVDYGSWDMHTALGTLDSGQMRLMADELGTCVAAFVTDLGTDLMSKVTIVTISEFGRRIEENGDVGLDHGYGNMMMLLGAGVKGGSYYGKWPGLRASQQVDGNLQVTTDYRSVLWEIVKTRFPAASLATVFPNFSPENVGVMQGA